MDYGQELRTEEASLKRLLDVQAELQRRIKLIERRIGALRFLSKSSLVDTDVELTAISISQISLSPIEGSSDGAGQEKSEASEGQIGAMLTAFARERIVTDGPQTIDQLIDALPAALREQITARGETQPLDFRVRRVFRRSRDFTVDRKSSRVTYVGGLEEGEVPIIKRLVVGPDAMESVVVEFAGDESVISIAQFSKDVGEGRLFGVRGPDRVSSVVFVDGFYRSMYRGDTNDDMRNVPRDRRVKVAQT